MRRSNPTGLHPLRCGESIVATPSASQLHRDGVIRGLVFMAILLLPFALTFGAPALHRNQADQPLVAVARNG